MDASLLCHLLLQQRVHQPMSRGLGLRFESFGRDDNSEMGFLRSVPCHGLVVSMAARVVVDFEEAWLQRFVDLTSVRFGIDDDNSSEGYTLRRIASSIGVCEAMVESGRLARAKTDRRSIY